MPPTRSTPRYDPEIGVSTPESPAMTVGMPPGIIGSLITPFNGDGDPDLVALGALIEFQLLAGIAGLFIAGTAGEGMLLTPRERRSLLEAACSLADDRIPIMAHCGAADTRTTVELVRHAASLGVHATSAIAPFYFSYGPRSLFDHFTTVAEGAPETPHYVYDNPARVGYEVGVTVVLELVSAVPNIVGVKDTGDSVGKITNYLAADDPPQVYTGSNLTIFPALAIGARGAVSALANAVPELAVAIFDSYSDGRLDEARALQLSLTRVQACLGGLPYLGAIKELTRLRGLPAGAMRAPQPALGADESDEMVRRLEQHSDLATWLQPVGDGR